MTSFEPTRNPAILVPSIVKHMPATYFGFAGTQPVNAASVGHSQASSPSPGLSLFGSSIWGPDADMWSEQHRSESSQRRGPLGSVISSAVNSLAPSLAPSPGVGPLGTRSAPSLSCSPPLEFFVPAALGDDAMDDLNAETFALGDDDADPWPAGAASLVEDAAMRASFSRQQLQNPAAREAPLVSQPAVSGSLPNKILPPQAPAAAPVAKAVSVTPAAATGEEEPKVSRRELKKKRFEERKRQQQLEKEKEKEKAKAAAPTAPAKAASAPAVAVTALAPAMQWKDVLLSPAKAVPPAPPVTPNLPSGSGYAAAHSAPASAYDPPDNSAEEKRLRQIEKRKAEEKKQEEKERQAAELYARRQKQAQQRAERKKEREREKIVAKRREREDWSVELCTCKHSPHVPVSCRLCATPDNKEAREEARARRTELRTISVNVKKAALAKREDEEQNALDVLAASLAKKDLTYARNICNRWRQKGYCVGGRKCQYDHPEEWKGMGARGDEPGTDVFELARMERKATLEAERKRLLAAKTKRKIEAAIQRGEIVVNGDGTGGEKPKKKAVAKKTVPVPYPRAVPSLQEISAASTAAAAAVAAAAAAAAASEGGKGRGKQGGSNKKEAAAAKAAESKSASVPKAAAVPKVAEPEPAPVVVASEPKVEEKVADDELAAAEADAPAKKKGRKKKKKGTVAVAAATAAPLVAIEEPPKEVRPVTVTVSMELLGETVVVAAPKNRFRNPPRSVETALVVSEVLTATSFVAHILVSPVYQQGEHVKLSVSERDVADHPLRQGEPLSGIVTTGPGVLELQVIRARILPLDKQGPLPSRQNRFTIAINAAGENYSSLVPGYVSATLNFFAGLKYECLLVDTEHQEFCRDCSGAVLDFIKPLKDADAAGLARLRSWLPRLSGLVAKAPIPQRMQHAKAMAKLCFAASVPVHGSPLELERLTAVREQVLALLRHDEWPSTVELHFNPIAESAAMGEAYAVVPRQEVTATELRFNEIVDRCLDDMVPQRGIPRGRIEGPRVIPAPVPLLIHWSARPAMDPVLVWAWHDNVVSQLLAEVASHLDIYPTELNGLALVLRRDNGFEMTLSDWRALYQFDLVPGDHLWIEEAWNTPMELFDVGADDSFSSDIERGIRQIAIWTDGLVEYVSLTYYIRIFKNAARYPLVLPSVKDLPDPLAAVSPEDRRLLEERLVGVKESTDPMEIYLSHLNYWMDVRSPSGALQRGMLAQPDAFTLNMDEPQVLLLMSQHEVRERIVYGEWDFESEESSSTEDSEGSDDTDEGGDEWDATSLCECCKFDNGRKQWVKCEQCGLVNSRCRPKGVHLASLPDRNTVVYWNKEWEIASTKQYQMRKRILSLALGEIWVDRLRAYIRDNKEAAPSSSSMEDNGAGKVAFRVRLNDSEPQQTQEVLLSTKEHVEMEPLDVEMSLLVTTLTGTPVLLDDLWTEKPDAEPRHRYVWIFGEPGVGKTWLSRHLCRLFDHAPALQSWRQKFDAVTRVFLPDLLRSCSQYGDLITSKELLDAAWSLCNPAELGLNTVRVGSAYERRTDRVLWILDGYDEAERMLDLENRRPGTNYRFMQGLASSSLYYLQNAIIFTRSAPELELTSATRLILKGISMNLSVGDVLKGTPSGVWGVESVKDAQEVSWEDVQDVIRVCKEMSDSPNNLTKDRIDELVDTLRRVWLFDPLSMDPFLACFNHDLMGVNLSGLFDNVPINSSAIAKVILEGCIVTEYLAEQEVDAIDDLVAAFLHCRMVGATEHMQRCYEKGQTDMMPTWVDFILRHARNLVQLVCKVEAKEVDRIVSERVASQQWRRPRTSMLHFVEMHVIHGVTRQERLQTAKSWIAGWQKYPAIAALLSNPLHLQLLCRVQRTRPEHEAMDWFASPELPHEPRELLISELHRHAITPILLKKENFDFAAGTVFGELELIKAHVMDEKGEKGTGEGRVVHPVSGSVEANGSSTMLHPGQSGLPRDSIESQSVREFLMSLWYMANPNNQAPLPRPSSKDQRWLFLLCLTPPSERWSHVLSVASRLKDRILRSKQATVIGTPEDIKSLGSPDAVTLLELLRVAHSLDRNTTPPILLGDGLTGGAEFEETSDLSLLHILREVMPDEPWLNGASRGLVSLPPIPAAYNAESGFWLCKAPYRHHSASVRMKVPSVVAWSAAFHLLPPPPGSPVPKGVAFSPATTLDHLLVDHNINHALIRPQSVFDTGSETGFVFGGWSVPNLCDAVVSPASESPSDWPMCWTCGDVTVDGIGCRLCRRQHHAFCARNGRKLLCCQCSHSYVCNFYSEARWCPWCGSDKICHVSGAGLPMPFCCLRCRVISQDDKMDPPPFVQEVFLQAAASMGIRAVVLACLHPSYRPREVTEKWASAAFHSASLHGHQELAEEIAKLFSSSSVATNLMRNVLRYRAARGLSLEKYSQYSLLFFSPDAHGSTPLHLAALGGHVECVKMLLRKSANAAVLANAATSYGATPLHEAAMRGSVEVVKLLLAAGANPLAQNRLGETALHLAMSQGHKEVGKVLLESGPLLNMRDTQRYAPIHCACMAGSSECAQLLLFSGADVQSAAYMEMSPLHVVVSSKRCTPQLVTLLIQHGARPLAVDKSGRTALSIAVKEGLTDAVAIFMRSSVDCPEDFRPACVAALAEACRGEHGDIVELLVQIENLPLNETSVYGATPLILACRAGSMRVVNLLLAAGARTDVCDNRGNFPIHAACMAGHAGIVEAIVKQEQQERHLFTGNDELFTPLHLACRRGASRIVRLLVNCVEGELEKQIAYNGVVSEAAEATIALLDTKPKRGRSSFILFVTAMRSQALEQRPDLNSNKELMNMLQDMWAALDPAEQQVYEDMAKEEKTTQDALIAAWTQASQERLAKAVPPKKPFSSFLSLCPCGPGGVTPLHLAAVNGQHECVTIMLGALKRSGDAKFRLNVNAQVTTPDLKETFTLTEVCASGLHRIAAMLLDCGPGISFISQCRKSDLRTPLHAACAAGSAATVQVLLERDAEMEAVDRDGHTPLQVACMRRMNENVIRTLCEFGAKMDAPQGLEQVTPFQWCCAAGPPFADNALALMQYAPNAIHVRSGTLQVLHDWMMAELERARLHEEEEDEGGLDESGMPLAMPEEDTPLSAKAMLHLLWRASVAAGVAPRPSSLPVKLVLQATHGVAFKHCLTWLRQFEASVRVDPDVIAEAKSMGAPANVLAFLEVAQKKQLESIKSSFLPDAAAAKQKQVVNRSKPSKKKNNRKK